MENIRNYVKLPEGISDGFEVSVELTPLGENGLYGIVSSVIMGSIGNVHGMLRYEWNIMEY